MMESSRARENQKGSRGARSREGWEEEQGKEEKGRARGKHIEHSWASVVPMSSSDLMQSDHSLAE